MKQFFVIILVLLFINVAQLKSINEAQILNTSPKQEWGYAEVENDAFLFWWFYMDNPVTKPLLIWLGFYSTAEANFNQYGPITTDLESRNNSLVYDYNILYIDSIPGAGFSYSKRNKLFPRSTHETAYDLFICIKSFFTNFPDFKASPVYIVADSFFGKIAPELAQLWDRIGHRENLENNLKGLILGNDPYFSLQAEIWRRYNIMKITNVDPQKATVINKIELFIRREFWLKASENIDEIFYNHAFATANRSVSLVDWTTAFTEKVRATAKNSKLHDLMNHRVKEKLNLQSTWTFNESPEFMDKLKNQVAKPVISTLYEELLETTDLSITLLNTPMDLNIDSTMLNTLAWIDHRDWKGKDTSDVQHIVPFTFSDKIKGFKKNHKNLHQYLITKNPNSDLEINADFLRTVFAEVME